MPRDIAKGIIAHYGKAIEDRMFRCFLPLHQGKALRKIEDYFNISESAVSQTSRKLGLVLNRDKGIIKRVRLCNV